MSTTQIIGALLLASPFVGIFIYSVYELGWRDTFIGVGGILALFAVIMLGSYLLFGAS